VHNPRRHSSCFLLDRLLWTCLSMLGSNPPGLGFRLTRDSLHAKCVPRHRLMRHKASAARKRPVDRALGYTVGPAAAIERAQASTHQPGCQNCSLAALSTPSHTLSERCTREVRCFEELQLHAGDARLAVACVGAATGHCAEASGCPPLRSCGRRKASAAAVKLQRASKVSAWMCATHRALPQAAAEGLPCCTTPS
jgi:hypothetical protein